MAPASAATLRRLAAAGYDGLLLLALMMIVTAALQLFTHGAAITPASAGFWVYVYRIVLAAGVVGYFSIAWMRTGQTLGMRAWGLKLETAGGARPGWPTVATRLAVSGPVHVLAIAGVLMWSAHRAGWVLLVASFAPLVAGYYNRSAAGRGTIIDRLSGTRVIRVPSARG